MTIKITEVRFYDHKFQNLTTIEIIILSIRMYIKNHLPWLVDI